MRFKIVFFGMLLILGSTPLAFAAFQYQGDSSYVGWTVKVGRLVGYSGQFLNYVDPQNKRYTTEPLRCNIYRRYRYWNEIKERYKFTIRRTIWGQTGYNSAMGGYDKQRCIVNGKTYVRSLNNRNYFMPDN